MIPARHPPGAEPRRLHPARTVAAAGPQPSIARVPAASKVITSSGSAAGGGGKGDVTRNRPGAHGSGLRAAAIWGTSAAANRSGIVRTTV